MHPLKLFMRLALLAPVATGSFLAFAQGDICADGDGFYPHTICSKFWKCDNNVAYERDCPSALLWNDRKKECDWPEESLCEDGEVAANHAGPSRKACAGVAQVTTTDLSPFRRKLEADNYRIRLAKGIGSGAKSTHSSAIYLADNPRQRLSLQFDAEGLAIQPLVRSGVGRAAIFHLSTVSLDGQALGAARMYASGDRLERRHAAIVEWYRNSPSDVEQGWTLVKPAVRRGERCIDIQFNGAVVTGEGSGAARVQSRESFDRYRYSGLVAWDANGRRLRAYMRVQSDERVRIFVDDRNARYPVTVDPTITSTQIAELTSSDEATGDSFGDAIAISGNILVAGAPWKNNGKGAAYVFSENQGGANAWGQVAELTAPDGVAGDTFGYSVAVNGNVAVIGAAHKNKGIGTAYVFLRNQGGTNNWGEASEMLNPDASAGTGFGISVAVSGDTVAVGAGGHRTGEDGAAYVFLRNQGGTNAFGQVAKLVAKDGAALDAFADSIAVDGDTVVVGAAGRNSNTGAVYIFSRNQGGSNAWGQVTEFTVPTGMPGDDFGDSVAVNGNTVIVGSPGRNSRTGAAFVYSLQGLLNPTWQRTAVLNASDPAPGAEFGNSVAVNGNTAVVGSLAAKPSQAGAAYLFSLQGLLTPTWSQVSKLTASDSSSLSDFGLSVTLDANFVAVGAHGGASDNGRLYVFSLTTSLL